MNTKSIVLALSAVFTGAALAASSTPAGFSDDLDAAIKESKATGKGIYAVFSGSDWCYWCKKLEEECLSKPEFVAEAKKNLILVFIDSPRDKSLLSETAKKRNPELVKKYKISGYPTVMFIDSNGEGSEASRPGKDVSPADYAKSLADDYKMMPLITKHIKPFKDEMGAAEDEMQAKFAAIGRGKDDDSVEVRKARFESVKKLVGEFASKVKDIRDRLEKATVPAEVEGRRKSLLRRYDMQLKQIKKFQDMTFEEADAAEKRRKESRKESRRKRAK